jgi:hypothetical protein
MPAILDKPWAGQTFAPPTPLDIATIETAIVEQLRSSISLIEIVHFPDRLEAYRMTHRIGAALVAYRGATYGDLFDSALVAQPRKLEFEVRLMARDLGWSYGAIGSGVGPGAYSLLEAVRAALTGFLIPGCRKIYPLKERFIERDAQGGVWIYAISFAVETVALEVSPPVGFPVFITGVAQDTAGNRVATVGAFQQVFDANGLLQLPFGNLSNVSVSDLSGRRYVAGTDYAVDSANGLVRLIAGGALAPGASVNVTCGYDAAVVIG